MPKYAALDAALQHASARLDRARQNLYYCDVTFLQRGNQQALRHDVHAGTYIYVAAAVEAYVSEAMQALVNEINAYEVEFRNLRLCLFAIARGSHLNSLQDVRGLKMFTRRADVFSDIASQTVSKLEVAHIPGDGGTIRPSHLDTLWHVFGLPGNSTPGPRHRLALTDLADNRNLVAHGEGDASHVAGSKSIEDVLKLIERIEESILHVYYGVSNYLDNGFYLR